MTSSIQFKQLAHLNSALSDRATMTLSADKLVGQWVNTNPGTEGLAKIRITQDGDRFTVSASAVGADGYIDWPATSAKPLANLEEEAGQRALALAVTFNFGFMTAVAYLRVNKGVLVIVHFSTFNDDSGRRSYVNREFFYRQD